jgi:two-component system CheB/CheR fusion protein
MVIFAPHDLINDPPFGKMDALSCRNLLIYMNPDLQKKILNTFHGALKLGGFLFLGPSENKDHLKNFFQDIDPKWKIYKNTEVAKGIWYPPQIASRLSPGSINPAFSSGNMLSSILTEHISDTMLEEQNMAGICINENYEIVRAFGAFKNTCTCPRKFGALTCSKWCLKNCPLPSVPESTPF